MTQRSKEICNRTAQPWCIILLEFKSKGLNTRPQCVQPCIVWCWASSCECPCCAGAAWSTCWRPAASLHPAAGHPDPVRTEEGKGHWRTQSTLKQWFSKWSSGVSEVSSKTGSTSFSWLLWSLIKHLKVTFLSDGGTWDKNLSNGGLINLGDLDVSKCGNLLAKGTV